MPLASGQIELWRRLSLLIGVVLGLVLYFYVTPAVIHVTYVNWEQEQADEVKSKSGFVSEEDKRLHQLPIHEYIDVKTGGKITSLDPGEWGLFFQQVKAVSNGQASPFGNRVSEEDKDPFWRPQGPVPVYFKPEELPFSRWGLLNEDGAKSYFSVNNRGSIDYFLLSYEDYLSSISAMYQPYRTAPGWIYHPYRLMGLGIMVLGLLFYIFLPRRKHNPQDIAYGGGRLVAGDLVALIILIPFIGLPFLINGGTVQAVTGMWPISLAMWSMSLFGVAMLYYSAWYASYRIELHPEALYVITFKGVRECRFREIISVETVTLRNPGWFRKLFLAMAMLSLAGGRGSVQPAGSALLAASAAYGGLEIRTGGGKPIYIWFTDQLGNVIIPNFDRLPKAIENAGIKIKEEFREIEGFSMFMQ